MHPLSTLAGVLVVAGAVLAWHGSADARQRKKQADPPQPPKVIIERDRWRAPQQPERQYYGPAPTIQPPMERVPMPAPLAQPPTNR